MAENFQTNPSFSILNNGQAYSATDGLSAEDLNKIVENLQYLYLHGGEEVDLSKVYPIGSYFITENAQSTPAAMFGGSWVKVKDKFLLGQGDNYALGNEGGSADAVVVNHTHTKIEALDSSTWKTIVSLGQNWGGTTKLPYVNAPNVEGNASTGAIRTATPDNAVDGIGKNMPPYRVVNIWRRTA